jgi:hypothetical protein
MLERVKAVQDKEWVWVEDTAAEAEWAVVAAVAVATEAAEEAVEAVEAEAEEDVGKKAEGKYQ